MERRRCLASTPSAIPRGPWRILPGSLGLVLCLAAAVSAQELEPRSYANAPIGLNFLVLGYTHLSGGIATDPSLQIENAKLTVHGPVAGYAYSFGIAGMASRLEVAMPYGFLSGSADIAGQPRERQVAGLWDPKVRLSIDLYGAPALTAAEFRNYRQSWIVGASVQVGVPVGQYDAARVVNLGTHRWSVKPEVGVSKAMGRVVVDLAAGATFYTENHDYPVGRTRAQEPVYALQAHLVYTFVSRIWLALDANHYLGGAARIDGVGSNDRLSSSRLGATLSLPIGVQHSIKIAGSSGVSVRTGTDFDALAVFWQYRWGGGVGSRK